MDENEARSLKAGDKVVYQIGDSALSAGRVAKVYWAAFEVRWDDGLLQVISFNEAHNIFQEGRDGRIREP
jgi:hypothetical protein